MDKGVQINKVPLVINLRDISHDTKKRGSKCTKQSTKFLKSIRLTGKPLELATMSDLLHMQITIDQHIYIFL